MAINFYFDVHIPLAITNGLRIKGIDVLTAQEDDGDQLPDDKLMERATQLNRVLFTFDSDLLVIGAKFKSKEINFSGLTFAHPIDITIGQCVQDLEIISNILTLEETKNQIIFLPI
jgi:hypothetical protein